MNAERSKHRSAKCSCHRDGGDQRSQAQDPEHGEQDRDQHGQQGQAGRGRGEAEKEPAQSHHESGTEEYGEPDESGPNRSDPSGGPNGFWAGSSGACGILDADPTGQYALIVFERRDDKLLTTPLMGAVFRDAPDDPTVDRFRTYIEDRLVPGDSPRVVPAEARWTAWLTAAGWPSLLAGAVIAATLGVVGVLWGCERWRNA